MLCHNVCVYGYCLNLFIVYENYFYDHQLSKEMLLTILNFFYADEAIFINISSELSCCTFITLSDRFYVLIF